MPPELAAHADNHADTHAEPQVFSGKSVPPEHLPEYFNTAIDIFECFQQETAEGDPAIRLAARPRITPGNRLYSNSSW
jgi:hypothetical protein